MTFRELNRPSATMTDPWSDTGILRKWRGSATRTRGSSIGINPSPGTSNPWKTRSFHSKPPSTTPTPTNTSLLGCLPPRECLKLLLKSQKGRYPRVWCCRSRAWSRFLRRRLMSALISLTNTVILTGSIPTSGREIASGTNNSNRPSPFQQLISNIFQSGGLTCSINEWVIIFC